MFFIVIGCFYLFDIQGWGKQIHSHLTLIMLTGGLWVNQLFEKFMRNVI